MLDRIKQLTKDITPRLIEIYRHLHSHPELSGQEYQTAAYVAAVLTSYEIDTQECAKKIGVVGELRVSDDKILAIRTDMDALPIEEGTGLTYASLQPGVMHACGHDLHTTVGLGTAMVLSEIKKALFGTVRFLFQPAEEITQGARWMIEDGVLDKVSAILSLHAFPSIPAGSIGIRYGALTAALDDLEIVIIGQSADGGTPHEGVDAILTAAQVNLALLEEVIHRQDPLRPVVLSIGKINGGKLPNIIADRVQMLGTVRCLDPETHVSLPQRIEQTVARVCNNYGASYEINYRQKAPVLQNDSELIKLVETSAIEALGNEYVQLISNPSLGAEDFSVYLKYVPGAMFRLGVGHKDKPNYSLHHPKFEVNEEAIATGVITLAYSAYKYFQRGKV